MTDRASPAPAGAATHGDAYYVLDATDRIVHASAGCSWMRQFLGHVVWECMPLAEIIFRPRFEEARRAGREVDFRAFYAGELSQVKAVPSGTGLPLSGSTISKRKWSSQPCRPLCARHSTATPGPMISERP